MTYLLKNPSGKIVEYDDEAIFKQRRHKKGFQVLSPAEEKAYFLQREAAFNPQSENLINVQFSAPQPNHDGYGQSYKNLSDSLAQLNIVLSREYTGQLVGIAYGYPDKLRSLKTPIKILFSMFESTKIPDSWDDDLKTADLIIVPSKFCQKAFKASGFDSTVIPLGYDTKVFNFQPKELKKPFKFLHYDAFNMRKGWDIVFKAFTEEFTTDEPVELILKTTKLAGYPFQISRSQYPNIKIIKEQSSHEAMAELLHSSHCFVLPSRGEGFGHPPLEALATGTPVIIPNAHGFTEFFDPKYFMEVKIKGETPALYDTFKGINTGKMIETDVEDLKKVMRFVYDHYQFAEAMAVEGAKWVVQNWTYEKTAAKLAEVINEYNQHPRPEEKEVKGETKLSIVVLSHNRLSDTKACLTSIRENTKKSHEVIVVDNGSDKEVIKYLESLKGITLIKNKENKGIPIARNQGMKKAIGEYICIMDNDVEVSPGWDDILVGNLEFTPKAGIVGVHGSIIENLNPMQFSLPVKTSKVTECDVVPGCLQVFRRSLLIRVGYLDEKMPNPRFWHEDLEFCMRIKESGLKVYTIDDVPYRHKGGESHTNEAEPPFGFMENAAYAERKHASTNVLTIHRDVHKEDCGESFCVLARNIAEQMREMGFVVVRKESVHEKPITFNFCKAFDMKFNGKKFALMHLENDRPPKNWLKPFESFDFAFNVSPHAYHNLIKWGFPKEKMINISPNGIDHTIFNFNVKRLSLHPEKFKFLTVGATQPRKGTDVLIRAYFEEFTGDDNTILIIKDYDYGWSKWTKELIATAQKKHKNPPAVEHIFEEWPINKLAQLYKAVAENGAYFHPHKGECFGLPIFEALACGARVGTTNATGLKYTLKELSETYPQHIHLFTSHPEKSTFHNWKDEPYYDKDENPEWEVADIEDCRKWARSVYETKYDPATARQVSKEITKQFKWENTVKNFAEGLKKYGI